MPDYLGKKPELPEPNLNWMYPPMDNLSKALMVILVGVFIAFLISLPFMIRDKNAYLDKEWKTKGCAMYDDYMMRDVPSKCQTYFIDHYKSQTPRVQPPEMR